MKFLVLGLAHDWWEKSFLIKKPVPPTPCPGGGGWVGPDTPFRALPKEGGGVRGRTRYPSCTLTTFPAQPGLLRSHLRCRLLAVCSMTVLDFPVVFGSGVALLGILVDGGPGWIYSPCFGIPFFSGPSVSHSLVPRPPPPRCGGGVRTPPLAFL